MPRTTQSSEITWLTVLSAPAAVRSTVLCALDPALGEVMAAVGRGETALGEVVLGDTTLEEITLEDMVDGAETAEMLRRCLSLSNSPWLDVCTCSISGHHDEGDASEVKTGTRSSAGETAKAIRGPRVAETLVQLAEVDGSVIAEWVRTDRAHAVRALFEAAALGVQNGTQGTFVKLLVGNDVHIEPGVRGDVIARDLEGYDGPVTAACVAALERVIAAGAAARLSSCAFGEITPDGEAALERASLGVRVLTRDVTPAELRAELGVPNGRTTRMMLQHGALSMAELLCLVLEPELITAVVGLLEEIDDPRVCEHVAVEWMNQDLPSEVRERIAPFLGASFFDRHAASPMTQREVELFAGRLARVGRDEMLRALGGFGGCCVHGVSKVRAVYDECLRVVPAAARAAERELLTGRRWMTESVMRRAHLRLGENASAWRLFLQELPKWDGLLDDLAAASVEAVR